METENEINKNIIATTLDIHQDFPELLKYITEIPKTISNVINPEMTC